MSRIRATGTGGKRTQLQGWHGMMVLGVWAHGIVVEGFL
jgi:hypothetical protein